MRRRLSLAGLLVLALGCPQPGAPRSASPSDAPPTVGDPSPSARDAEAPDLVYRGGPPVAVAVALGPPPCWQSDPRRSWRCVDADGDGHPDDADQCPDAAEVFNGTDDDDGCPDQGESYVRVDEDRGVIELLRPVTFEPDKATIRRESLAVLDHVVAVLRTYQRFRLIEVASHDRPREERYGMRLTDKRARAVYIYLVSMGIHPERIRWQGYGEERPIDTNRTAEGRRRNERVEIYVIE